MFEFEAGEAYNEVMENKPHYKLSVRELVEAALPQGDLVLTPSSGRRLQEGTRLHQQYQQHVETPRHRASTYSVISQRVRDISTLIKEQYRQRVRQKGMPI